MYNVIIHQMFILFKFMEISLGKLSIHFIFFSNALSIFFGLALELQKLEGTL